MTAILAHHNTQTQAPAPSLGGIIAVNGGTVVNADNIPRELRAYDQWVTWRYEPNPKKPKPDKVPYSARHQTRASVTAPGTWANFGTARWRYESTCNRVPVDGIGFVLTSNDPFVGIDLDNCIDGRGQLHRWAADIVRRLDSYTEISPSGTGIRMFVRGTLPPAGRRRGSVEMYDTVRYVTVTGNVLQECPQGVGDRQLALDAIHAEVFAPEPAPDPTPRPQVSISADDNVVIEKMRSARNGAKMSRLLDGQWQTNYDSWSSADLGLCNALVYWTGSDPAQMDRIFRSSRLMRPKWDAKHRSDGATYGDMTIQRAMGGAK